MKYNTEHFISGLKELDIELSENQINQFIDYYDLLIEWNSFMNLTAITDWEDVVLKHFIDSLSLINAFEDLTDVSYSILDIGTGAGFPGIPLKIAFPNLSITLVDSLGKRVKFLNEVINRLSLNDIRAFHGRAEDFAHDEAFRESFDIVVSRAVTNMTVLSEYCLPYVKVNGCFVSYKSEKIKDEYNEAKKAINILGGKYLLEKEFNLPDSDIYRNLFVIKKNSSTPKKFPRKAGLPSKEPLN